MLCCLLLMPSEKIIRATIGNGASQRASGKHVRALIVLGGAINDSQISVFTPTGADIPPVTVDAFFSAHDPTTW